MKKRIVIALGHRALGTTLPEQKKAVKTSASVLADMVEEGYQLVITHSNAPQVGMIHTAMNEFGKTHPDYTVAPMSVCSAMSQGYIGYDLQNAIRAELLKRGIFKTVSTILTQVIVDPYDDAFHHPVGIPVLQQGNELKGASAIIEKDYASGKLAEGVDADILMILTNDKMVDIDRDTEHPRLLEHITVEEAKEHIAADQFGVNSMLPKICASVDFITAGRGRSAIITNLEHALDALKGKTGTIITE